MALLELTDVTPNGDGEDDKRSIAPDRGSNNKIERPSPGGECLLHVVKVFRQT